MKKNIFAVCDLEADYARNFMDYLNRKNNIPFEIQAFTTVEGLLVYGKTAHIELLLISGKAMCKEVRDMDIGKIVILSEGVYPPELDRYPSVYKYQSSAEVIREVMACYGEGSCPGAVSGIEEDDGDIGSVFAAGAMSEDLICLDTGADIGKRPGGSVSQSGRICGL